jgi:hypothetical protein
MQTFNTHRKLKDDFLLSLPEEDRKYFIEYVSFLTQLLNKKKAKKDANKKKVQ